MKKKAAGKKRVKEVVALSISAPADGNVYTTDSGPTTASTTISEKEITENSYGRTKVGDMKKLNSRDIVRLMKEEYERKLVGQLNEMKIYDSRGKMILGKDLKVKHEPSGFVYTVLGVQGEPGNAKIVLRAPEEPRIKSQPPALEKSVTGYMPGEIPGIAVPPLQDEIAEDSDPDSEDEKEDKRDYGKKAYPKNGSPPAQDKGEVLFVVDQKEFEKHYKEA